MILTANPLIHHKRILRAKRQNHGRSQGKPLKVIDNIGFFRCVRVALTIRAKLLEEIENIY
jgi:hypothetical protein